MATEQRDNSGILFRNHDKSGERDRDYKGEATISGVEYWMSGWIKEGLEAEGRAEGNGRCRATQR